MIQEIVYVLIALILILKGKKGCVFLLAIFVGAIILFYIFQNRILYPTSLPKIPILRYGYYPQYPSQNKQYLYRSPSNLNLHYENISIITSDNITLKGWRMEPRVYTVKRSIVIFHHNIGNIGRKLILAKSLAQIISCNVILVAYRGYSESQGIPSQEGIRIDASAIMDYAIKYSQQKGLDLFIYGDGFGGAVAIYISSQYYQKDKIDGLIVEQTFTSVSDVIGYQFPWLNPVKKLLLYNHWQSRKLISKVQCPILFIKSQQHQMIPTTHMNRLINRANTSSLIKQYNKPRIQGSLQEDYFKQMQIFIVDVQNTKLKRLQIIE